MRIPCPNCGSRSLAEFSYGGAALDRPPGDTGPSPETAPAWDDFVYRRDNPAGPLRELWFHAAGCRAWFVATRDTRSLEFIAEVTP